MSATGDDVRAFALSLPETAEQFTWGMPTFRVAGKLFLTLPEAETSMAVRCPIIERDELVVAEPAKFWIAAHEAANAWVRVRLAALDDRAEMEAIVADSWRQAAPRQLLEDAE
ncbi:MmcQ/YjbR family DNA-binding protein [Nocardia cyriacigeorgica]|uniref:MmcQ/YjbR family DNA-binding protein n=1 Tax=Nocardia cyriacigeorgica TaxID=135487 RepID=UPI001892F340|nr:MmcQ/YjbR family DNA-binding protein [Nocardia cyriacigeorgica]MBF6100645.1 MmcQ/YjbR family DNA-binding protein [Nocardia cyriacigeorgica]MBF6513531.1 MmcQ/YjbR family DNA-binding protein [Nocardia cyriacigeorgica]